MDIDRTRRVGELIQRELAQIINTEMSDPRIRMLTITSVRPTRDLRQATVYVTQYSGQSEHTELIEVLVHASGYLRRLLSQRAQLRITPRLDFVYDSSTETGIRLTGLIDRAREKDKQ